MEIYQVIDERCEQEGISDVPVIFEFTGHITVDVAEVEGPYVNESDGSSLSGNEEEIADNETTNKMPSFTSIITVLGLLSLLIIKRLERIFKICFTNFFEFFQTFLPLFLFQEDSFLFFSLSLNAIFSPQY